LLERKGLPFREIKIDENPAEREAMLARSGGRRTVPQIFVGDHHVGGFDELYALDKAGKLDALTAGA
jgi:glutaredoxin 3